MERYLAQQRIAKMHADAQEAEKKKNMGVLKATYKETKKVIKETVRDVVHGSSSAEKEKEREKEKGKGKDQEKVEAAKTD